MPLFEITDAQLSFRYSLTLTLRAAPILNNHHAAARASSISFRKDNFNVIKAVATFESNTFTSNRFDHLPLTPDVVLQFEDDTSVPDEREKLRRLRISKANKGNTPWNKGRKHSPETLRKIKERTRLAMQNPKVKMKLINLGHAQTTETRIKIGVGVRRRWEKRRGKKMVQEACYIEWQSLLAEASRQGYVGQKELQWNSYETLDEQLKQEWLMSVERRKQMSKTPANKRAPKSLEQRRKIAEAIAAKWADPDYRERVCSALAKYHGTEVGAERKPRRRLSDGNQVARPSQKKPTKKRDTDTGANVKNDSKTRNTVLLKKSKSPAYKDPLVNAKLEMIKNIRAQRAAAETIQTQAIERARLLIAEAEKAAKALEVAATKSPIAQSSLIETRKLIAEAIQSLESIETQAIIDSNVPSVGFSEVNEEKESAFEVLNQSQMAHINGHTTLSDYKFSENFGKISLEKPVNGDPQLHLTNGWASLPFSLNSQINESSLSNQLRKAEHDQRSEYETDTSPAVMGIQSLENETVSGSPIVTKKWVRGRLVDLA